MKPLVILAVMLATSTASAQTVRPAPLQQATPAQPAPQQPLILDPKSWGQDEAATAPGSSFSSGNPSSRQPSTGPTLTPSIGSQPVPDAMPPDRRQEYVPTLRLKVPL